MATLSFERLAEVIQEAQNGGLLSQDPVPGFLRLQPIFPYFLRSRLYALEQREVRSAVETAFRQHYDQVGGFLYRLLNSKELRERQVGHLVTSLEYDNLVIALNLALAAQVSIHFIFFTLSRYLDATQDERRGLELSRTVLNCLESYPAEKLTGQLGPEFVGVIDNIGKRQLALKEYKAAEISYQKALALHLQITILDTAISKILSAGIYHQLGRVAQEQRQWQQAEHYYQQALHIKIKYNHRHEQAKTYHQLGIVAQEQQQWAQAEYYYQQALKIFIEVKDTHWQADTNFNLGRKAVELRQWQKAEQYFQQALQIYIEYKDHHAQAETYHFLGVVARELRQWQQAEQYFQQALLIKVEYEDDYAQAGTYQQLGGVAEEHMSIFYKHWKSI